MKQNKNIILLASLMSTLVLTGCASNDELIAQQKNQTEQMGVLESKVSTLESQMNTLKVDLQSQKETDSEIYQAVRKLDAAQGELKAAQGELKAQAEQQADEEVMYYTIKQNDTLYSIARNQGIALGDLLQLNPKIDNPRHLLIGDVINIK